MCASIRVHHFADPTLHHHSSRTFGSHAPQPCRKEEPRPRQDAAGGPLATDARRGEASSVTLARLYARKQNHLNETIGGEVFYYVIRELVQISSMSVTECLPKDTRLHFSPLRCFCVLSINKVFVNTFLIH